MATRPSSHTHRILILSAATVIAFAGSAVTQSPRFYPDDPLAREPESQDAAAARPNHFARRIARTFCGTNGAGRGHETPEPRSA